MDARQGVSPAYAAPSAEPWKERIRLVEQGRLPSQVNGTVRAGNHIGKVPVTDSHVAALTDA